VKRSDKKDFVDNLKKELSESSSVIVAHYSGITVNEAESLRKEMRANGAKFKVTKNRLTKLALADTQFKDISDLFSGPTAVAYSTDPVAPAKVAVDFEKKFENKYLPKTFLIFFKKGSANSILWSIANLAMSLFKRKFFINFPRN